MVLVSAMGWSQQSFAHTHLTKSSPEKGAVLSAAPTQVNLWFTNKVDAEWSSIKVFDASGNRVDKEAVTNAEGMDNLRIELKPLSPGKYEVKWSGVSGDGHRVKGSFSFTVK